MSTWAQKISDLIWSVILETFFFCSKLKYVCKRIQWEDDAALLYCVLSLIRESVLQVTGWNGRRVCRLIAVAQSFEGKVCARAAGAVISELNGLAHLPLFVAAPASGTPERQRGRAWWVAPVSRSPGPALVLVWWWEQAQALTRWAVPGSCLETAWLGALRLRAPKQFPPFLGDSRMNLSSWSSWS